MHKRKQCPFWSCSNKKEQSEATQRGFLDSNKKNGNSNERRHVA